MKESSVHQLTSHLFRENAGKMVGLLCKRYGYDKADLAMDVVQDSFEAALSTWKFRGLPDQPAAWLMRVAINKMINRLKQADTRRAIEDSLFRDAGDSFLPESLDGHAGFDPGEIRDSQLNLLFFFCERPAPARVRIILTLCYLCGFGYAEIGNALWMKEEAVKKSLHRHKKLLHFFQPDEDYLKRRLEPAALDSLLDILYLLFNEGYKTTRHREGIHKDLCYEAMRLAQLVLAHLEDGRSHDDGRLHALLALMFFNVSRFPARLDEQLSWIRLEDQDRSQWDRSLISEGFHHLNRAAKLLDAPGRFYLEALISSLHCTAPDFASTDWTRIGFLYRQLEQLHPGHLSYRLNRIIAESHNGGVAEALREMTELGALLSQDILPSYIICLAYLYEKSGDVVNASRYYDEALRLTRSPIDQRFIQRKKSSLL